MKIPFNKPFFVGNEIKYMSHAVKLGKISGDGFYTKKCHHFFETKYGFKKALLTTSCTDALEMAAILIDTKDGDEIIVPSYTFVSTANAFVMRGAKILFADSTSQNPNIDAEAIEKLITKKTKAIVVVHYAGIACNMDAVMALANKHNLFVIEDAAQAIDSYYKNKPLGSIGHLAAFSFHETKNVISGEGGMLVVNDERFIKRAEIIREKGTNRTQFFRGEVNKYEWVDIGSSFLPSELIAAFLYAQLENIDRIQKKRIQIWNRYKEEFTQLENEGKISLPKIPAYASNNGHMFYIICKTPEERTALLDKLKHEEILAVFHYIALHNSPFYKTESNNSVLKHANDYTNCLIRLPLFYNLKSHEQKFIIKSVIDFYK